ncbi:hypothetical protein QTG56_24575 (plasmid) [Rossellomorea sp. AcN35-11]|nr:hypothetical protein [Rossellomorea aquimaris]WJV31811.1 hypothetical protein QTG56_24575 [Rossellomorea sp. AcN35-11]
MIFVNANDVRNKEVDVNVGDRVKLTIWDLGIVEGIVVGIKEKKLMIENGSFNGGCYEQVDYSGLETQSSFEIDADEVFECEVASFNTMTPLTLVNKALSLNFCGSESLTMSPSFYKDYMSFMKDGRYAQHYSQYPINVDYSLRNEYVVKAVPNQDTLKHMKTPLQNYWIDFYLRGKWEGSHLISVFPDELLNQIDAEKDKFQIKTNKSSYAFRVRSTDDNSIVARGTLTLLYFIDKTMKEKIEAA